MAPRITVVTICRNVLPALERTVASVLAQDYPGLEYLIVDGASTDGTTAYLQTLAVRGVRTLSEPDRGISDAMNKGVRLATGDWIAHLHADDEYLPGALATVARHIGHTPADILCGAILQSERSGEVTCPAAPDHLPVEMAIGHPAMWTRREVFERFGGFDVSLKNAMDYDFFLRAWLGGARFAVMPETLTRVAWGGQSERSLWKTLRETHQIRRRLLPRGFARSPLFLGLLYAKGSVRQGLQALGLAGLVTAWRRAFSAQRKR